MSQPECRPFHLDNAFDGDVLPNAENFDRAHVFTELRVDFQERSEGRSSAAGLDVDSAKEVGAGTRQPGATGEAACIQRRAIVLKGVYHKVPQLWRKVHGL